MSRAELSSVVQKFPHATFTASKTWLGLGSNQHWQTIVGSGALKKVLLGRERIAKELQRTQCAMSHPR